MRTLTIKRTKCFVGALGKFKVYREDPEANELVINNVPCRKLGELKNGEEQQFSIGDNEARVYVIAGRLSKNYCSEYFKLPAGTEDIFLSGQSRFNLATGNAFRFDGQTDPDVLAYRKKSARRGTVVLVVAAIVGLMIGFVAGRIVVQSIRSDMEVKEETFISNGMEITLTDAFWEAEFEEYTAVFNSKKASVFALREDFDLVAGFGDYTLEEYAALVLQTNGLSKTTKVQKEDGLIYFEYEREVSEKLGDYYYLAVVYKSSDAFWLIQFATSVDNKEDYQQDFLEWAKTVKFTQKGNSYA